MSGHADRQTDGSTATRAEKWEERTEKRRPAGNTWEQRERIGVTSSPSIRSPHLPAAANGGR